MLWVFCELRGVGKTPEDVGYVTGRYLHSTYFTLIVTSTHFNVFYSNFDDGVLSSTVRAHRLSMKAYRLGGQILQIPLLAAIFKAYTTDSKDIGSLDVLGDAAESAGVMSKEKAIEFLKGDELKEEVLKMAESAKANGVKGVPLVIIDGRWALSGGQKAEIFVQVR
jgi:predicted DsbA family dithiol-disulfide isomerase